MNKERKFVSVRVDSVFATSDKTLKMTLSLMPEVAKRHNLKEGDIVSKELFPVLISDNCSEIRQIISEKWTLHKHLIVTMEQYSEGDSIACFSDANIYGYGDSIPEALDDLKERLINQLEFLLAEEKRVILGPVPKKQLEVLRYHIKKGVQ